MSMTIIRQAIMFVENPLKEDGDALLEALLAEQNTELTLSCLHLLATRNLHFNPCGNALYKELADSVRMNLIMLLTTDESAVMNQLLTVFPEHVINPDPEVRRELTRQWYNECRTPNLPKWKTQEEALDE